MVCTSSSTPLKVKGVEPHIISITALMRADATGLAKGQGVQNIPPDSRTMIILSSTYPEIKAGGSFWNVEPRESGWQSICEDLWRVTKLFVETDIQLNFLSYHPCVDSS